MLERGDEYVINPLVGAATQADRGHLERENCPESILPPYLSATERWQWAFSLSLRKGSKNNVSLTHCAFGYKKQCIWPHPKR